VSICADQNEQDYEELVEVVLPDASRQSKVSEHPVIGPPAGPSVPSVVEGLSTVEVRWILPGQLDAAVAGWFGRKWSFPFGQLAPNDAGPPAWTVVHKRRRMSRFRLAGGRLVADVAERATGSECGVELTEVRSGGETWWSLGFEATGPADLLRRTLEGTAALMFAKAPPGEVELDMGHCQSYAEWLSRHRVTTAIHPWKGEEPPARRRQDQSSSRDQRREGRTAITRGRGTPWLI
jgi:hypothetical protein